jgi:hypothetical protein
MGFSIKWLSKRKISIQSGGEAMFEGILGIVAGLLLAGGRLFLAGGWAAGVSIRLESGRSDIRSGWLAIVVGLVAGVVFAWLATRFIKIAAYFLAFFAGAVGLPYLAACSGSI